MPPYHCCLLDERHDVVRTEVLEDTSDEDAYREAMKMNTAIGRVSGFEVWTGAAKCARTTPPT